MIIVRIVITILNVRKRNQNKTKIEKGVPAEKHAPCFQDLSAGQTAGLTYRCV